MLRKGVLKRHGSALVEENSHSGAGGFDWLTLQLDFAQHE